MNRFASIVSRIIPHLRTSTQGLKGRGGWRNAVAVLPATLNALSIGNNRGLMPKIKLHYDGWLALPVSIRQRLGVTTGDELQAEVVGSTLRLTANGAAAGALAPEAEDEPAKPTAAPIAAKPALVRKKTATKPRAPGNLATAAIAPARGRQAKPKKP